MKWVFIDLGSTESEESEVTSRCGQKKDAHLSERERRKI
jgi:hypothetical protein